MWAVNLVRNLSVAAGCTYEKNLTEQRSSRLAEAALFLAWDVRRNSGRCS
jgi:hypothetical protein